MGWREGAVGARILRVLVEKSLSGAAGFLHTRVCVCWGCCCGRNGSWSGSMRELIVDVARLTVADLLAAVVGEDEL